MKNKHIRKVLLLVAITILLIGLASAATTNKTNTNKDTKVIKDNTKSIKTTPATTKKASTKIVTNNKTQINKVKEKISEKTTQKIEKNKQKNTKTETETVNVGDWVTLNNTIENIREDTTIKLERDLDVTTEKITLNKQGITVTIDGNGQTINGKQKQVFHIEQGSTLHLKNITITNATTTGTDADAYACGGAIYNNGTLTINNSTLQDNTANATTTGTDADAYACGGAIYNDHGTLTINNSTLQDNTANATTTGTDADAFAYGGAIYNNGTLTINNSTLQDNTATATGTDADAFAYGGAIYDDHGTLTINNSTLQDNTANATTTATYADAYARGGAIYNDHGTLTINNSTLQDNTANATTTVTYAYAYAIGGAIYNNYGGTLNITHSTLQDNTANATTTATYADAYARGGAIYNDHGTLTINNSTLQDNTANATTTATDAKAFAYGGAINNNGGTLNITHSTLQDNTANATGTYADAYAIGGAIYNSGTLTINNSTLQDNTATETATGTDAYAIGGAIHNIGNNYNISDTTFYKNTPANFIINETNNIQLVNEDYISIDKFSIIVDGEEIGNNTTYASIGDCPIPVESNNVEIIINGTDVKTKNNHYILKSNIANVTNYTELVEAIETAQTEKYNTYIINLLHGDYNATQNISWLESATKNLIINGNNITLDGKHEYQFIRIGPGLNLTLNNITIRNYNVTVTEEDNQADAMGGAIENIGGNLIITHSTFTNNTANATTTAENTQAHASGGVIHNYLGNVTITDSTFANNQVNAKATGTGPSVTASAVGGAIYNYKGNVTITDSTFTNNTAKATTTTGKDASAIAQGGAIYNYMGNVTITYSTLTNNKVNATTATGEYAKAQGGAIYVQLNYPHLVCEIVGNHFEGNRAKEETIYLTNTETTTIKDNTYKNTTIGYNDFKLTIDSSKTEFLSNESLPLKYNVTLINQTFYDEDILDKLTYEITIENAEKLNVTGLSANIKLKKYKGKYTANVYNDIFQKSNPVEFTVTMPTGINMKIINNTMGNVIINVDVKDINGKYVTSGVLKVYNNDKEIASIQLKGKSENITLNFDKGEQTLKLEYKANSNDYYLNSTLTDEVTIISKTSITLRTKNVYVGDSVVFNGTLKDSKGRGLNTNITVTINNKKETVKVTNGKFQIKYTATKKEKVKITIAFPGDKYNLQSKLTKTFKVQKIKTVIIIKSKKSQNMDKIKLTATITDQNNKKVNMGKVIFKLNGITIKDKNGKVITAKVSKGQATLTFTPNKNYYNKVSNITAVYSENNKYQRSENNAKLTLKPRDAVIKLQSTKLNATQYDTITIKTLSKDKNKAIKEGYVIFKINNKTLTKNGKTIKAKIKNGKSTLKYNLNGHKTGKYTLTAVLSSTPYKKVTSKTTLKITEDKMHIQAKPVKTSKNKTRIKAKILDTKNEYIKTTIKVSFKIDQKTVAKQVKVKNGKINVKIPTNVTKGKHTLNIVAGPNYRYKVTRKNVSLIKT